MRNSGPIIIVDDDMDDQFILKEVLERLQVPNETKTFKSGIELLVYLRDTEVQPFLILCDINMPQMDGLELRKEIDKDPELKERSIPFIFFTTGASEAQIRMAYQLTMQGLFLKESSFEETERTLKLIIDYWDRCRHPNIFWTK